MIIDKRIINLDLNQEDSNLPDYIAFLIIVDQTFPNEPPKILAKSNVRNYLKYNINI